MTPEAHLTLHHLVFLNRRATRRQCASICGLDNDAFHSVQLELTRREFIDVFEGEVAPTPLELNGPVYEYDFDRPALKDRHFKWLFRELHEGRRRKVRPMTLLAARQAGADEIGGGKLSRSKTFQAGHDLNCTEIVVAAHKRAVEHARFNIDIRFRRPFRGKSKASPADSARRAAKDYSIAELSPLISPPPEPAPGAPPDDGSGYHSILTHLDHQWFGDDYLRAHGLCVGDYVPDIALVRDGRIIHAMEYAGLYKIEDLYRQHRACHENGVTYEVW